MLCVLGMPISSLHITLVEKFTSHLSEPMSFDGITREIVLRRRSTSFKTKKNGVSDAMVSRDEDKRAVLRESAKIVKSKYFTSQHQCKNAVSMV